MPEQASAQPKAPSGRCVVIFSPKGGVGKSAVAANVAVALAKWCQRSVCLVDLDVLAMGDLGKMLGLAPTRSLADIVPALKQRSGESAMALVNDITLTHASGARFLPGTLQPRQAAALEPFVVSDLLPMLKARYDFVIVDGGKAFTDQLVAAFDEANLILLVVTPDIVSLYQTKWAVGMIESMLFPSAMIKAVLNRAQSRGGVESSDARLVMPCELLAEIPSDGRSMVSAINQGAPVVTLYEQTKIAEAFKRLADVFSVSTDLFLSHRQIPRHHRAAGEGAERNGGVTGTARFYFPVGQEGRVDDGDEMIRLKRRIHAQLVNDLDLKHVDLALLANQANMQEMRRRCEQVVTNLLSKELGGVISSREVRARLVNEILDEALGLGPLEDLLSDPSVSDILVNNKDQIYVERHGRLELTRKKFISDDQVRAVIERIVTPLGRRIDESVPMVDARLPDGSRVNAIIPPLSVKGPTLSIRKFVGVRYTQEELIKFGSLSSAMSQFIRACVLSRKNLVISGGTGSGKTTILNIISYFIPEGERIITIEDAAELKLAQTHWVSLEARPSNVEGRGQVAIRDLFRNALRMRPDRIIIGECRSGETMDMLQAMNTGHDGSMTTVHANSPRDVVSRFDSMVLMSNVDLPVRAIREMTASAVDIIVHTARLSDGSRKIVSISELIGLSDGIEMLFRDLFVFQQTGVGPDGTVQGQFVATGYLPTFLNELKVKGLELDEAIFQPPAGAPAPS